MWWTLPTLPVSSPLDVLQSRCCCLQVKKQRLEKLPVITKLMIVSSGLKPNTSSPAMIEQKLPSSTQEVAGRGGCWGKHQPSETPSETWGSRRSEAGLPSAFCLLGDMDPQLYCSKPWWGSILLRNGSRHPGSNEDCLDDVSCCLPLPFLIPTCVGSLVFFHLSSIACFFLLSCYSISLFSTVFQ